MSFYTLKLKYIFFLLFLSVYFVPEVSCSQPKEKVDHHSEESAQWIGEILFTANINGLIENCKCGKPPLGGLPQISTLVNKYITENKYTYYLDGGDFLNTYPYPKLNAAVLDIYKILSLKYLVLGDQEWIDNDKLDHQVFSELENKIIASNFKINNFQFESFGQLDLKNGLKAFVLSYLDEKSFFVSDDKKEIQFSDELFASNYQGVSGKKGLMILLYHGTRYTLDLLIKKFPGFNLILWGHEQSTLENIGGHTALIGGGSDGEYLKKISILKDEFRYKFSVQSIPVTLEIGEDLRIKSIVNEFKFADDKLNDQD